VLEDVGQRLLDDPVHRHVNGRGQRGQVLVDGQVHRQAGGPDTGRQDVQVSDARLRGEPGLLVRVAQDAEQAAGLGLGLPGAVLDLLQGLRVGPGWLSRCPGAARLQHDDAEMVSDDVVQFPGDPGPFGRRGLLGLAPQGRAPRGQRDSLPAGAYEHTSQPERQELKRGQGHRRGAEVLREGQPEPALVADLGQTGAVTAKPAAARRRLACAPSE